jgi:putative sigma-54 modulation protein
MRIDVIGRHLEVTDAIREFATGKAEKLLRFFDGTQLITVVLAKGKKGAFDIEIRVDVVKHEDFISHASGEDLYGAVELAIEKAARQLKDFKERLKQG